MTPKIKSYQNLVALVDALLDSEGDLIANLANVSALLFEHIDKLNWVGFNLKKGDDLVLGPFQGKVACSRIPLYKGVCGKAMQDQQVINVPNVLDFPGHIVCDHASRSEIVIPMVVNGHAIGVLDVDAPIFARFDDVDAQYLSEIVDLIIKKLPDAFNQEA